MVTFTNGNKLRRAAAIALAVVAGVLFSGVASATIVGQLDFGGVWDPIDAAGNDTSIGTATGIRFHDDTYPILLALGVFSHLAGQNVTIETQQFQFAGPFPFTLWSAAGGSVRFDMDAVVINHQDADSLDLTGNGQVFVDGQTLDGRYLFTGQGAMGFTFSSTTEARQVPAPAGLGLLGLGLVGLALARRLAQS
jgi:hypothetical protein